MTASAKGGVPVAIGAAEPTYQVRIIEHVPSASMPTMRLRIDTIDDEDSSDGIPCEVPPESSRTVAVVLGDLASALEIVEQIAKARCISMYVIRLRAEEVGLPTAVSVGTACWKRFRKEFPGLLQEAQPHIFRSMREDAARQVTERLRAFAEMIEMQKAPGTEHYVYRFE